MKNRLRVLRAEHELTQEALGKAIGVSRQAVNALETGKHVPSLDLAFRLASLFSLPVEQIFENPHPPRTGGGTRAFSDQVLQPAG